MDFCQFNGKLRPLGDPPRRRPSIAALTHYLFGKSRLATSVQSIRLIRAPLRQIERYPKFLFVRRHFLGRGGKRASHKNWQCKKFTMTAFSASSPRSSKTMPPCSSPPLRDVLTLERILLRPPNAPSRQVEYHHDLYRRLSSDFARPEALSLCPAEGTHHFSSSDNTIMETSLDSHEQDGDLWCLLAPHRRQRHSPLSTPKLARQTRQPFSSRRRGLEEAGVGLDSHPQILRLDFCTATHPVTEALQKL